MKPIATLLAILLSASVGAALAADPKPIPVKDMKAPVKWHPEKRTTDKDGRFHYVHVKKQKMDCEDCHADESKDRFFLRNTEAAPATLTAHVNRKECQDCHQPGKKQVFYGPPKD